MRRMRFFASRNAREILRDPISVGFGVAFPILLLLLLSFLNRHIPAEAHMTLFEPEQLAPGVSVFSLSFLALFWRCCCRATARRLSSCGCMPRR